VQSKLTLRDYLPKPLAAATSRATVLLSRREKIPAQSATHTEIIPMPRYVDGFVIPVPKRKVTAYQKMAAQAGKVWKEHGALDYFEGVGDDLKIKGIVMHFPKLAKTKSSETVVFSFIVYKSRAHRDAVNKKVMADPRIADMCPKNPPFDFKRMAYGGFKALVDL